MARFEFTMVSDAMMQGLFEAGATAGEIIAYQMLVRGLPKNRSNAECWMPADMAEVKVGMDAHTFSKQLRSLSRKTFTTVDGEPKTVLTKVTRGCRGHCPHFEDTLGLMAARGQYPPRNGDPQRPPNQSANGDPKQTPINEFSTLEWGPKTNQLGTQLGPL